MNLLPKEFLPLLLTFASLFSKPVWKSAVVLLVGAIVAPGKRTVSAILQVMGMQHEPHFQNYHRVLSRAIWSSRQASRLLLQQLVTPTPRHCQRLWMQRALVRRQFWQTRTF